MSDGVVLEIIRDYTGENISLEAAFEDLKIDSLEFIEILHDVENAYSIRIGNDSIPQIRTVRDLIQTAENLRPSK